MKQTAVEYLKEKLMYLDFHPNTLVDVLQWIEQAKEMEARQKIDLTEICNCDSTGQTWVCNCCGRPYIENKNK